MVSQGSVEDSQYQLGYLPDRLGPGRVRTESNGLWQVSCLYSFLREPLNNVEQVNQAEQKANGQGPRSRRMLPCGLGNIFQARNTESIYINYSGLAQEPAGNTTLQTPVSETWRHLKTLEKTLVKQGMPCVHSYTDESREALSEDIKTSLSLD